MPTPHTISDAERRARLAARHHLGKTGPDVVETVRSLVALHSSDPATPYLSLRARLPDFTTSDLERALLDDRQLWRLHAMRRTLFIVPAADGALFEAAAGRDVARKERRRLEKWLGAEMDPQDVSGFVARLEDRVLEVLDDGGEKLTRELSTEIPELSTEITVGSGKWATRGPISSRLLFLMAMEKKVVRTRSAGSWRSSQYAWTAADAWFDDGAAALDSTGDRAAEGMDPATGRARLARRYLEAFGPAMFDDLRWWTGWTVKRTRDAVAAIETRTVRLEDGRDALLLERDEEAVLTRDPASDPLPAFLPGLDPTPMGWTDRDWFLGPHADRIFDRNGNIGPSLWLGGRIVGGWAQRPNGHVVYELLEDVGSEAEERIAAEAAAVTDWLDGTVVIPRFRTPLEKALATGQPA